MKITIIVAKSSNNVIGKENQLVWRLQSDLQLFKRHTTGHHLIMGRKTYESVGKPLPNRTSIVITRNTDFTLPEGHYTVHSIEEAVQICIAKKLDQVFIIGGAEIYAQAMSFADEMMVTEVHAVVDGDAFFPDIDKQIWKSISREHFPKDANNEFAFDFVIYKRKQP